MNDTRKNHHRDTETQRKIGRQSGGLRRAEKLALLLVGALLVAPSAAAWYLREPLRESDPDTYNLWAFTQEQGGWDPSILEIPANTSVRLRLVALDQVHGFRIENPNGSPYYPLFEVSPLVPGEPPTYVTLPPLPAGEYTFSCSVACSQLHTSQTGRLVVAG